MYTRLDLTSIYEGFDSSQSNFTYLTVSIIALAIFRRSADTWCSMAATVELLLLRPPPHKLSSIRKP